jgi:hypothetical protein
VAGFDRPLTTLEQAVWCAITHRPGNGTLDTRMALERKRAVLNTALGKYRPSQFMSEVETRSNRHCG